MRSRIPKFLREPIPRPFTSPARPQADPRLNDADLLEPCSKPTFMSEGVQLAHFSNKGLLTSHARRSGSSEGTMSFLTDQPAAC